MWSGLGGMVAAFLSVIGFPQSDDARVITARRPHHHVQAGADVADGDEAAFAVVPAIVHGGQRGFPVEPFGGGEVHAMLGKVGCALGFVPGVHFGYCNYKNTGGQAVFVTTATEMYTFVCHRETIVWPPVQPV